jgi:hypothetical protein
MYYKRLVMVKLFINLNEILKSYSGLCNKVFARKHRELAGALTIAPSFQYHKEARS